MDTARLLRYLFVGGFAYFIEMLCLYCLHDIAKLPSVSAVAISFWIGFFVAFALQKILTFKNHEKRAKALIKQIVFYGLLVGFNYCFSIFMVASLGDSYNVLIVRTVTIAAITCWNFWLYKSIIFKASPATATASMNNARITQPQPQNKDDYEKS